MNESMMTSSFSASLAICAGNSQVTGEGQWRGALMFHLICTQINGWVNNREPGDLRRHRAHYDITVMDSENICCFKFCLYNHRKCVCRGGGGGGGGNGWGWLPHVATFRNCKGICVEGHFHLIPNPWINLTRPTHWDRMTHICVGKLTIFGSDNGLSPGRRQAIIWTNAGILLIWPLGTNFGEILMVFIHFHQKNAFENVVCEMASILSQPQCVKSKWGQPRSQQFPPTHCGWRKETYVISSSWSMPNK